MTKTFASIAGVSGFVPEQVLTNNELARIVDTTDEWIVRRTGIKERHILKSGLGTSFMASRAVSGLLQKTSTSPDDIDLLICATATPDFPFPATANLICDLVGINGPASFDLNVACSGFIYALSTASQFIETGKYENIIVVGADTMSANTDYTDRTTSTLIGDGAGAILLKPNARTGLLDFLLYSDGSGYRALFQPAGGSREPATPQTVAAKRHFWSLDGRTIYKHAVVRMSQVFTDLLKRNNLTADMIDWFVPHQANRRIIEMIADQHKFPRERVMTTIQKYGNTIAASIPLCLWDYEPALKRGDRMILASFGSGFTWAGAYLEWDLESDRRPVAGTFSPEMAEVH